MLGEVAFNLVGQVLCEFFAFPDGVEQECASIAQTASHVVHVQVGLNMASHEVGRVDEIGRADGLVAETKVRACEAARFLRVVGEISLTIFVGVVADDFYGVLVSTDSAVSAETVELGFESRFVAKRHFGLFGK